MGPILDNIKAQPFDQLRNRFVELLKLLERNAINRFYCVGFCWGVWAAFKFATEFKQIGSIAGMHPSLGVEQLFGG